MIKALFSKINLKILNAASWITVASAYVLPFASDGAVKKTGIPFAFMSVYENTADSLFGSFHISAGALVSDIAVVYVLLVCALKISEKIRDK